jgi:hypothetical protein
MLPPRQIDSRPKDINGQQRESVAYHGIPGVAEKNETHVSCPVQSSLNFYKFHDEPKGHYAHISEVAYSAIDNGLSNTPNDFRSLLVLMINKNRFHSPQYRNTCI